MRFPSSLESLASFCARRPWYVVVFWVTMLVLSILLTVNGLSGAVTNEMRLTTDFESVVGMGKLEGTAFEDTSNVAETIIVRSLDGTTVDDPVFADHVNNVATSVRTLQGEWVGTGPLPPPDLQAMASGDFGDASVLNYFELRDAVNNPIARSMGADEQINQLVSEDRTVVIIPVTFAQDPGDLPIREYIDQVEEFDTDRFDTTTIGNMSINDEFQIIVEEDLIKAELFGVPIAVLVLIVVFGALVAPIIPLVLGVFSVGIGLGVATIVGQFIDLQLFIQNMMTMLGLAIGIDYSLFVVERYREQRAYGFSVQRSIEIAGATSGKAVMFSGITVILAMIGVMFVRMNIFFSLGLGAIIVVAMAIILTATMLPAMLSLFGDKINWPRKRNAEAQTINEHNMYEGFWGTLTRIAVARPWVSAIAVVVLLLALAIPILDLRTGFTGSGQLPEGELSQAYDTLEQDFSAGLLAPMEVVFEGERTPENEAAIAEYIGRMNERGDFVSVPEEPRWDEEHNIALVEGTLVYGGSTPDAYDTVRFLRNDVAEAAVDGVEGLDVYVTGLSAGETDMLHHLDSSTPPVFVFVLSMSFILLTLAFRSVVVPVQAIIYNLLSVGATWGILVGVFSKGWGRDLLGYSASPIIESWAPILLFCVLFGLSMDYHVFILSRIREHYDISHNNRESVAVGLRTTGKIITGAALIMVVVFGAFSMGSMLALQQLGFGLAVAVLIDATLIRSVLVPAVMTIVGDRNWYLPSWLNWLPDLRIEGDAPTPPGEQAEKPAQRSETVVITAD